MSVILRLLTQANIKLKNLANYNKFVRFFYKEKRKSLRIEPIFFWVKISRNNSVNNYDIVLFVNTKMNLIFENNKRQTANIIVSNMEKRIYLQ